MAATLRASLFVLIALLVLESVLASRPQGIRLNTDLVAEHGELILQDSVVKFINQKAEAGWKASMNPRFANHTIGEFKRLLGVKPLPESNSIVAPVVSHKRFIHLPKNFDAREAWPQCSTISRILDQGHCGSCWAFGAVESLSDRFCIRFGQNLSLSANDLLACCDSCGDGCDGGYPILAWQYFVETGVVTEQCDPYFDTQGCSHPGCEPEYPTPTCPNKCSTQNLLWQTSKHFSVNAYRIRSDPYSIMAEIFTNGPVEVSFTVYQDFAHYKSGIYRHILGGEIGGHAVKLIGWGTTDDGEDYWLLANQWNRSWGEDGYFKILRGVNECGIEEDVVAGLPSARNIAPETETPVELQII